MGERGLVSPIQMGKWSFFFDISESSLPLKNLIFYPSQTPSSFHAVSPLPLFENKPPPLPHTGGERDMECDLRTGVRHAPPLRNPLSSRSGSKSSFLSNRYIFYIEIWKSGFFSLLNSFPWNPGCSPNSIKRSMSRIRIRKKCYFHTLALYPPNPLLPRLLAAKYLRPSSTQNTVLASTANTTRSSPYSPSV